MFKISNKHSKISGGFKLAHKSWKGWILIDDYDDDDDDDSNDQHLFSCWYFRS
jgi:hypothetical protein